MMREFGDDVPAFAVRNLPPGLTLALLLIATNAPAVAIEFQGTVDSVLTEGIDAWGVSWTVSPGLLDSALRLQVQRIEVEGLTASVEDVELSCLHWQVSEARHACPAAELSASLDGQPLTVGLTWESAQSGLRLSAESSLFDGRARLELEPDPTGQRLSFVAEALALDELLDYLELLPPEAFSIASGRVSLDGRLATGGNRAEIAFSVAGLSFDSSDGTIAGAGLGLSGTARIDLDADPLAVRTEIVLEHGEALYAPIYLSLDQLPQLRVEAEVRIDADGTIALPSFALGDGESLAASGSALIAAGGEIAELVVELEQFDLPLAFDRYLQTALESRGIKGLRPSGQVRGRLEQNAGEIAHMTVALDGLALQDQQSRFLIDNLNGIVDYDSDGDSVDSELSWDLIGYYALAIRAAEVRFFVGGRQFRLLAPLFAPVLDGGFRVAELALNDIGLEAMSVDFQGAVEPISLELITRALDWPVLTGTLSGQIPRVRLRGGVGEVGGAIRLDVFDGEVIVDQVKLERVFGVLPTLAAEVEIHGVDLRQMTGAFSFGEIQGRLDGTVHGLRLLNWQPVAFDLKLQTPEGYRGKRKISQRAVDNLSSLGGGAAVLSQTVLRFFKKFSYKRLGLSCSLLDNVCRMGGVAPAARGFYIVEGAGVPRINIIGFSTEVDWPKLIRRLKAATRGGAPTID